MALKRSCGSVAVCDGGDRKECSWCGKTTRARDAVPWENWLPQIDNLLRYDEHVFDSTDCMYTYCKFQYPSARNLHQCIEQHSEFRHKRPPQLLPMTSCKEVAQVQRMEATELQRQQQSDDEEAVAPFDFGDLLGDGDDEADGDPTQQLTNPSSEPPHLTAMS